jgi:hypothetical protein
MSLFKRVPLPNKDNTLSVEMIDPQLNDYIVPLLESNIADIRKAFNEYGISSTKEFFNNKHCYPLISRLDTNIKKRFGLKTTHVSTNSSNYSIFTAPPKSFNVLNSDIVQYYDYIKEYFENKTTKPETTNDIKHESQYESILNNWMTSVDKLEKILETKGVIVDLHKAVIHGLPDDYTLYMFGDFHYLINDLKLSDREIVAIIMHEIGHGFTHIEYSYRSVKNTAVLVDTLKDNILNKNKSHRDALIIAYETAFKDKLTPEESKNVISVSIAVMNKYIRNSAYMSESPHAYTDSEQVADQFAGRFGLSADLAVALSHITGSNGFGMDETTLILFIYSGMMMIYVIMSLGVIGIPIVIGTAIIGYFIGYMITTILNAFIFKGDTSAAYTYDDNKRRMIRIKNELVRQLRISDLPKEDIGRFLSSIKTVEDLINLAPENKKKLMDKIYIFFSKDAKLFQQTKYAEQLIEDLLENDLHVAAAKINQLKDL